MEKSILELFLYNKKLKFSEIEKQLNTRSNKIAYHIKNLIKKQILERQNEYYKLSETAEKIIPYITKKQAPLPVILIAIKNKDKIFLHKREKRPFQDKLSLPGGRLVEGEKIKNATKRIMKEKFGIDVKFKEIHSISLEHVKRSNKILHSFLLILVSATTKDNLKFTNIKSNKSKIISSDYKLIKNNLNKKIEIENLITIT